MIGWGIYDEKSAARQLARSLKRINDIEEARSNYDLGLPFHLEEDLERHTRMAGQAVRELMKNDENDEEE